MKLKDIPKDYLLAGKVIKIPKQIQMDKNLPSNKMVIKSGWIKGLWLKRINVIEDRIYPLTFKDFKEIENLEIVEEKL